MEGGEWSKNPGRDRETEAARVPGRSWLPLHLEFLPCPHSPASPSSYSPLTCISDPVHLSLFIHLPLSLPLCLSICFTLTIPLSVSPLSDSFSHLSPRQSISLSLSACLTSPCLSPCLCLSCLTSPVCLFVSLSSCPNYFSLPVSVCRSPQICLPLPLGVSLSSSYIVSESPRRTQTEKATSPWKEGAMFHFG